MHIELDLCLFAAMRFVKMTTEYRHGRIILFDLVIVGCHSAER